MKKNKLLRAVFIEIAVTVCYISANYWYFYLKLLLMKLDSTRQTVKTVFNLNRPVSVYNLSNRLYGVVIYGYKPYDKVLLVGC